MQYNSFVTKGNIWTSKENYKQKINYYQVDSSKLGDPKSLAKLQLYVIFQKNLT